MYKKGIIFDGDDTLWETSVFYKEAREEFFDQMALLGFAYNEVEDFFNKTDLANVVKLGFTKKRFPSSMIETYQAMCRRYDYEINRNIEEELAKIGENVFQRKPLLIDCAEFVLDRLKSFYYLILATKGDAGIQRNKIQYSGLSSYFQQTYILEDKTEVEIQRIVDENELCIEESWAIGNSLKSDINPALKVGLKAIWIPHQYTWTYEDDSLYESLNFHKANSLKEVLEFLF